MSDKIKVVEYNTSSGISIEVHTPPLLSYITVSKNTKGEPVIQWPRLAFASIDDTRTFIKALEIALTRAESLS